MTILDIPAEILAVIHECRTCELSTLAKDGTPITWPTAPIYQAEEKRFLITTSIGLPQKALNIRRDPRVSLLFSDFTASNLVDPPTVLVQGDATAPDEIHAWSEELALVARTVFPRQPAGELYSSNLPMRYLFAWYYIRLCIYVIPRHILWWERGDFNQAPNRLEVRHVE